VEEICAVPGLTGVYVGPGDLSVSLGLAPMDGFSTDQIEGPLATIRAAATAHDVVLGIHSAGGADAARWARLGCRLISLGSDMALFRAATLADRNTALDVQAGETATPATPYAAR
jgi:2-keto-3-deoxy-L-rhamnonate aldolase RhmA